MANQTELEICRRRNTHSSVRYGDGKWNQCKHCGIWYRDRIIHEEREDEPPSDEIDSGIRTDRNIAELQKRVKDLSGESNSVS